jgi:hypothetical protein
MNGLAIRRFGYRIASVLVLFAALWVLDVRVGGLRLIAGGILACISLGLWDAAKQSS